MKAAQRVRPVIGALSAVAGAYAVVVRPRMLTWGTAEFEPTRPLPGDDLVPDATYVTTRAISVNAPVAMVWPWVVQIGQNRGGFYTYDALENLFGLDIHSADRIVAEWQSPKVGEDYVTLDPGQEMKMTVALCEPEHAFVIVTGGPGEPRVTPGSFFRGEIDGSWAFVLEPTGDETTRLVVRFRARWRPGPAASAARVAGLEPAHFVMERGMLRGIKRRAERGG
jgi:hypothetical protein